ncbi:MAG: phosphoribosylformylglycinamidine synthase subunit PurL, partial [Actinomycetota bacterium]
AMYAAMWSEHCSYKSSKMYLRTLPTKGPRVVMGPGENAGVVDVGDDLVAVFKLESHNHPSAVEPVQGAATGVGGIIRDVIATGARPVALLDPLRFGPLDEYRQRWLLGGIVHGISQYGNSIGVPTVGGEVVFDPCYRGNPLVNVMCVGVARIDDVQHARAAGVGNVGILFGAKTGRDGIGGVSVLASRPFDAEAEAKRPSVQVGDPFTGKLLIEATLELVRRRLLVGLSDLGGAGLCCATSETSSRGEVGLEVDLDVVPAREVGMEPFELLTSESQERMFAIVRPEDADEVEAVCRRWGVPATRIATVVEGARLRVKQHGKVVADVPSRSLADEGPVYERPAQRPDWQDALQSDDPLALPAPKDLGEATLSLLSSLNIASKQWVTEQYDWMVQHNSVEGPGGDAAVVRLEGTRRGMALATDGNARYCLLDPHRGAALAVAEAARNVACTGARPIAVTNCLNFGNPERPDVMWQFGEAVAGIAEACAAFATPVTGGNVSFYNETDGDSIKPTPVIGMLGIIENIDDALGIGYVNEGDAVILLGETNPELGGSEWAWHFHGHVGGMPPALDLVKEKALHDLLAELAEQAVIKSAHDCSDGGVAVALAECAIAGGIGATIELSDATYVGLFSESSSRAVVTCAADQVDAVLAAAGRSVLPAARIGKVSGDRLIVAGAFDLELSLLVSAHRDALARAIAAI